MNLFQETDYRKVVKAIFQAKPKFGRGQVSLLARHLQVNTTLVSQVLSGRRDFTEEQAASTARFLQLNAKESYYFLLLVQLSRAAHSDLKDIYAQQIQKLQTEAKSLKGRISTKKELSFEEQAVYYSSWIYAAIHTAVNLENCRTSQELAKRLNLELALVQRVVDQLLSYQLLEQQSGRLAPGVRSTYLPPESPLVIRHHQSWRQVATQSMNHMKPKDLYFTAPFSISTNDFELVRKEMTELIARLYKTVEKTKSQNLVCLNIDLFNF